MYNRYILLQRNQTEASKVRLVIPKGGYSNDGVVLLDVDDKKLVDVGAKYFFAVLLHLLLALLTLS